MKKEILTIFNHDRNIYKSKYIYPVVSRRSKGLSLGINLNTNNACNWQCIYCQVSNLKLGKPADAIKAYQASLAIDPEQGGVKSQLEAAKKAME